MGHVFISYAREDSERAVALATALERSGVSIWLDEKLVAGTHYDAAIEEALASASKVIVLWSPSSVTSRWVRAEAGDGLDRGILVPVIVQPTVVPLEFRRVQAVDLSSWTGDPNDHHYERLLEALGHTDRPLPDTRRTPTLVEQAPVLDPSVRAECLYASKALSVLVIRLWIGDESVRIRHSSLLLRPVVTVDGKTASRGPLGFLHDYHRFPVEIDGRSYVAELTISGGGVTGMDAYTLRVDSKPVLTGQLSWKDHWLELVILTVLGLSILIMVDPLQYVVD